MITTQVKGYTNMKINEEIDKINRQSAQIRSYGEEINKAFAELDKIIKR